MVNNRDFGIFNQNEDFFSNIGKNFLGAFNNAMKTDIVENNDQYEVKIDLPGFKKDGIRVDYQNDNLIVHAKHAYASEQHNDDRKVIKQERSADNLSRSYNLPNVDEANIKATYNGGILDIILPKQAPDDSGTHHIEIQ